MQDKNFDKNEMVLLSNALTSSFDKYSLNAVLNRSDFDNLIELKIYLTEKIAILLEKQFDKLINLLYRIDVNEKLVNDAFSSKNKKDLPAVLADLIIERHLQKIHFRKKYKNDEF